MADFNIKFKYEGMGKAASIGRQSAISASRQQIDSARKKIEKKPDKTSDISALKTLDLSIKKLIDSNKSLERAISGRGGGSPGGGGGGTPMGGSAGFGRIGASIPLIGAGIAALGFTIQKVNEIGNAYIEKTSQQIGNVGVGGFRFGQGVYRSAEMGAGMKAYGMATGRFETGRGSINRTALNVGAIYGLSAEEALGTAGKFKRAGANYQGAVFQGAGMGIQSELPILLSGMASVFEEAIKNGVDTSNMGKDMAKNISALALATPGKSVDAALNIMKSYTGIKGGLERGQIGGLEGMYGMRATRTSLMSRLTGKEGKNYLKDLKSQGYITEEQFNAASKLGPGSSFADLQRTMGTIGADTLFRKQAAEMTPEKLAIESMKQIQQQFGTGAEGFQQWNLINRGGTLGKVSQSKALWDVASGKISMEDMQKKGAGIISGKAAEVQRSAAGMGVSRDIMRENLVFKHGAAFADASMKMEKAMITVADTAIPIATKGITALGNAATGLATKLDSLIKIMSNKNGGGAVEVFKGLFY